MKFINYIISGLVAMEDLFFELYWETYDWVRPFNYVSYIFRELGYICVDLGDGFMLFGRWVDDVTDSILDVFNFSDIYNYFKSYFTAAILAWDWVVAAWTNITKIVSDWWDITKGEVNGWIDIATQGFDNLVVAWDEFWNVTWPQWTTELESIGSELSNFFTVTLPALISQIDLEAWWRTKVLDVGGLITTALQPWTPLLESWQDLRDKVTEFFTDPLEFLLTKFTDWFLGPEE